MIIINKCQACGSHLQVTDLNQVGYVLSLDHTICQRCFKLANYSELSQQDVSYSDFVLQFEKNLSKKRLIFYVVDIFDLSNSVIPYFKRLSSEHEIVILANKKDILPKLVKEVKLLNYLKGFFRDQFIDYDEMMITSAKQKLNIDAIVDKIQNTSFDEVYFVGMANVGKTSIVKECLKQLNIENELLITSLPGTTLDTIAFDYQSIKIVDTPGIMPDNSFLYDIDYRKLKHLLPQKEIKPITFQMNAGNSVMIDDFVIFNYDKGEKTGIQFYFSNALSLHRYKTSNTDRVMDNELLKSFELKKKSKLVKVQFEIRDDHKYDFTVAGIGFVTCKGPHKKISFICPENIKIEMRRALV